MTVREQLINDLLKYPTFIKNKWSCYHQWFAITGNGMVWENGELIDGFAKNTKQLKTLNDVIDATFQKCYRDFEDSIRNYTVSIFDCGGNDAIALDVLNDELEDANNHLTTLKLKLKMLLHTDKRAEDFTQSEEFFPLTSESILCNLPEDGVNDDWKIACKEFYDWIGEHYNEMTLETQILYSKIKTPWLIQDK